MNRKKKIGLVLAGVAAMLLVTAGGLGFAGYKLVWGTMNNRPEVFRRYLPVVSRFGAGLPFVPLLDRILDGTYIVLLQNNSELRATGGFAGSYAKLKFEDGGLSSVLIQDIYEPDGKLPGHVEPPYPIQEAFGQGWWKLRDANWDPDFASASAAVSWFMRQGGETEVDGIIGVNLGLLEKWVGVFGEVEVMTYGVKVTRENLYSLAQTYAETRTEGNKTQKREFLGALGTVLLERTKIASVRELTNLSRVIWDELEKGQILMWMKDDEVQAEVIKRGWDGAMTGEWDGTGELIYVTDTNLGANKSDCCIKRDLKQEVLKDGDRQRVKLTISRQNNNPFSTPIPPYSYGGLYVDYVRVIVSGSVGELKKVVVGERELKPMLTNNLPNSLRQGRSEEEYAIESRGETVIIGFWLVVEAGQTGTAQVELVQDIEPGNTYKVIVRRQPGIESFEYELWMDGVMKTKTELDKDQRFRILW